MTSEVNISDSNGKQSMNWRSMTSDWLGLAYRLLDCILLFVVLCAQNFWISYCIQSYNSDNKGWYFSYLVDFVMTFLFMFGAFHAVGYYRKLHVLKRNNKSVDNSLETKERTQDFPEGNGIYFLKLPLWTGPLPLIWICWLFYVFVMSAKIFILHLQNIALHIYLHSSKMEGHISKIEAEPHTIRLCLGAITIVFLLWVEIHRNHRSNQSMECVKELTTTVVFEIFDSIDLLDLLLPENNKDSEWDSNYSEKLSVVIVILSTINLLLPTIGLFRLSQSSFHSHKLGLRMSILHNSLRICFVNIPYMVMRITFWLAVKREISIFLLKNALFLFISIRHIVSEVHELRKSKPETKDSLPLRVMSEQKDSDNQIED